MLSPPTVTARLSGRSRAPLQVGTRLQRHQVLDPLARVLRVGVLVAAVEAVQHAVEAHVVGALAPEAVVVGDRVAFVAGAVEQQLAVARRAGRARARRCRSRSPRRPPRAGGGGRSTPPCVHGSSAPSVIESVGSGTISSGSITRWKPSPWQRWQAPCGELKEKIRGSISGIEAPQLRQAKRSRVDGDLAALAGRRAGENARRPACSARPPRTPSGVGVRGSSISSTSISPSASCDAASIDSARRLRTPSFMTRRSTTIEMSCLNFLSSSISSSRRRSSPSITARA